MRKSGYKTIEEWEEDVTIFKTHPDDTRFLKRIVLRIEKSPDDLKKEIKGRIHGDMMEKDPLRFFEMIMESQPRHVYLVIKSQEDPWFEV